MKSKEFIVIALFSCGLALLSGCTTTTTTEPGPSTQPSYPIYDRDDLIKEPEPVAVPLKEPRPDGQSHLQHDTPDTPLYERPASELEDEEDSENEEPSSGEKEDASAHEPETGQRRPDEPIWKRPSADKPKG